MTTPQDYGLEPVTHSDKKTRAAADAAFWAWWDPYELSEHWFTEIHKIARDAWNAAPQSGWISVDERLPEPGMPVLLDIGRKFPLRAMWAAKHTVEASDECPDDWAEYHEETDMHYCPEGWYEWNECEETHWRVSAKPIAWMEIPLPPSTKGEPT